MTSELEQARAAYAAAAKEADRLVRSNAPDWSKHKGRIDEAETAAVVIAALEAEVARLQGEREAYRTALVELASDGTYGGNGDGEPGFAAVDSMATYAQDVLWEVQPETRPQAARQHDDGGG